MTRRHAQVVLLVCAVAWILFSILVAPGIVQSAYDGRSYEILNRLISGRSEHPVEFYLRRWNIASWTALIVAMAVLLPIVSFTPRQLFNGLEEVLVSACAACLSGSVSDHCCRHATHSDAAGKDTGSSILPGWRPFQIRCTSHCLHCNCFFCPLGWMPGHHLHS